MAVIVSTRGAMNMSALMPVFLPVVMSMIVAMSMVMVVMLVVGMSMAVTMPMRRTAAIAVSTTLRLKCLRGFVDDEVHGAQHVGEHVVGLDLQVVGLEFDGHVPIAQVVSGTHQVERRAVLAARRDDQHRLRRSHHFDERAVFGHQHIAAAHHGAAWQKDAELAAL